MADPWAVQSIDDADPWAVASVAPAKPSTKRKRSTTSDVSGGLASVYRGTGVLDEVAGGFQTAANLLTGRSKLDGKAVMDVIRKAPDRGLYALGDIVTASGLPQAFRQGMADQRAVEDEFIEDRPIAGNLLKGSGMAATALVPGGQGTNLLAGSGRAVNAARGATVAGLTAAGYAAADRGTAKERLKAASDAGNPIKSPLTYALGAGAGAIGPAKPRPVKAAKVSDDVKLLAEEGVQLTPGQMRGGVARSAEDAGTSLPMLGQAISERRAEGVQTFNRAMVNRALKPIGKTLPDDVPAGTEAVKYAGDLLSKGYESAVPGRTIRADPAFADDVREAFTGVETLTPRNLKRLGSILDQRVTSRLPENGAMDGRLYKRIQSELDREVTRFSKATDPDERAMGEAILGVQKALEAAAKRQDPQFAARIKALDRGWAELGRIEAAAAKSTDLSGIATPKQYAGAIRMADARVRRRGVARGEALSQDLARAGVKVLPPTMPDSGTAGRSMWGMVAAAPGAVIGAITGGGVGAVTGIGGTAATLAAASRIYTPEAVQAANVALRSRASSEAQRRALRELAEIAMTNPQARKLHQEVLRYLARPVGVAAGAEPGRRSAVSVEVVGRPDLGVGYSSENLLARP